MGNTDTVRVGIAGHWTLTSYLVDGGLVGLERDIRIDAEFVDGRLTGQSGCNRYMTSYRSESGSIEIEPPAGTRKLCSHPDGIMELERRYLEVLPTVSAFLVVDGRHLELIDRSGGRVLVFETG
jgi:heat shock protein HslJ